MISKEEYRDLADLDWSGDETDLPCPECESHDVIFCLCNDDEELEIMLDYYVGRFYCRNCGWRLPEMRNDCENCQGAEAVVNAYLSILRNDDSD